MTHGIDSRLKTMSKSKPFKVQFTQKKLKFVKWKCWHHQIKLQEELKIMIISVVNLSHIIMWIIRMEE